MAIYQLGEHIPEIDPSAYLADSATVIGKVHLGANVSVWFGATLRGDTEPLVIGDNSNLQESCVLHTDTGYPLTIGKNVTVGHQAMLHGCTIGKEFPDNSLIVGSPAKVVRTLTPENIAGLEASAVAYVARAVYYKQHLKRID